MEQLKKQRGITLIALVITIIVMLVLVGISLNIALNGGLFITAKQAKNSTEIKIDEEVSMSNGVIEVNEKNTHLIKII